MDSQRGFCRQVSRSWELYAEAYRTPNAATKSSTAVVSRRSGSSNHSGKPVCGLRPKPGRAHWQRNFWNSSGRASSRRRRCPNGYSISTRSLRLPSWKSSCTALAIERFSGIKIVARKARLLDDFHFLAQAVNARIGGGLVFIIIGRKASRAAGAIATMYWRQWSRSAGLTRADLAC